MTIATTKTSSMKIALIALVAALAFVVAASTFAASVTQEAQAVKGEAADHISTQAAANQSPQGAASSGRICGVCE